jgi:CRISPR-associated protein Cmr6
MMTACIPAPAGVRRWADRITHPGLLLDKYVESYDERSQDEKWSEGVQRPTLERVVAASRTAPEGLDFPALLEQWKNTLRLLTARHFECETTSPLTLHLARASALENAGICLHPVYGFTYLPGSGLKGMAHAYATQVWHPAQPGDPQDAWERIRHVFGWSPSPLLRQIAHDLTVKEMAGSCAGSVVFHDAWPVTWPRLIVDIVNNHHPEYYQSGETDQTHPPGDWRTRTRCTSSQYRLVNDSCSP